MREQLLGFSSTTIDRLLKPYKALLQPDGIFATCSTKNKYQLVIPIMRHILEIDRQAGLVALDTVTHCGLTAEGQFPFTLTDTFTGWTVGRSVQNKASKWIVLALDEILGEFAHPIDHAHTDQWL